MRLEPVLLLAAGLLCSAPARAFVCSRAASDSGEEGGPSLSWFTRNLDYTIFEAGTADIAGTAEQSALRASFAVWPALDTGEAGTCASEAVGTDLQISEAPGLGTTDRIGYDFLNPTQNENLMIFRDDEWPHDGQVGVIALTTATYNALNGEILDADIEFNTAGFTFTASDTGVDIDLINTAVHEIGHYLGLGHTRVVTATMFARAERGETSKRDLACDDVDGLVFKYPAGAPNGYCDPPVDACGFCAPPGVLRAIPTITVSGEEPDSEGGCGAVSGSPWFLLAALVVLRRRVARSSGRCG